MADFETETFSKCRTLIEKQNFKLTESPPFFIHYVISWCGSFAQNLNRRTKPFLFFLCGG